MSRSPAQPPKLVAAIRAITTRSARRPKTTILLWFLLIAACIAAGSITGTRSLNQTEAGIGESGQASKQIKAAGLKEPAGESILVRSSSPAKTAEVTKQLAQRLRKLGDVQSITASLPGSSASKQMLVDGGRGALTRVQLAGDPDDAAERVKSVTKTIKAIQSQHPNVKILQAGDGSVESAISTVMEDDLRRAEIISLPITLLILVVAFGALVAASVPLLLGITSVAGAIGFGGVISQLAPADQSTASVVVLIGLAVGVDYSLFYIRREREERRNGRDPAQALDVAAATVGRAIFVSGLTVLLALAGLLVTGSATFISMALGTMVVVAIAVIGSLTVVPAALSLLGDRIDRGRIPFLGRLANNRKNQGRFWMRLADAVTAKPAAWLAVVIVVLAACAIPALGMRQAQAGFDALPENLPVVRALNQIESTFPGAQTTAEVVIQGKALRTKQARRQLQRIKAQAQELTGGKGSSQQKISADGKTAVLTVPLPNASDQKLRKVISELRKQVRQSATQLQPQATALVAGGPASDVDFSSQMRSKLPLVLGFVLGLAWILLQVAFRSWRLGLVVIALNLLSISATYGILTTVFQGTWAQNILDFRSSDAVAPWLPVFAFVVLFGLSMDYTILVLERIREARLAGLDSRRATAVGVGATAGAVTSAAAVMVAVFSIFVTMQLLDLKQFGFALAVAVLIDATIVRAIALPAAVALLGDRAFSLPRRRRPVARQTQRNRQPHSWDDPATVASYPLDDH